MEILYSLARRFIPNCTQKAVLNVEYTFKRKLNNIYISAYVTRQIYLLKNENESKRAWYTITARDEHT